MSHCKHLNEITDVHEGVIICTDCGVIKDPYYIEGKLMIDESQKRNYNSLTETILDKINISEYYIDFIEKQLEQKNKSRQLKSVTSEIYSKINKVNNILPLKTLMNISGLRSREIKSHSNIQTLNTEELLEVYTRILSLDFKTYTLIKEKIRDYRHTGNQPLTVIAGIIYLHLKKIKKPISMKKIASVVGISTISIQRFVKNDVSSRV